MQRLFELGQGVFTSWPLLSGGLPYEQNRPGVPPVEPFLRHLAPWIDAILPPELAASTLAVPADMWPESAGHWLDTIAFRAGRNAYFRGEKRGPRGQRMSPFSLRKIAQGWGGDRGYFTRKLLACEYEDFDDVASGRVRPASIQARGAAPASASGVS